MKKDYDVIIVGAGPAGIMCAYELAEKNKDLKILLLDKGHDIYNRKCPIIDKKIDKCPVQKNGFVACNPYCSITNGFGGAGAYSDGKFNITSEFGGWMDEYLEPNTILDLIKYADSINLKFGAPKTITNPNTDKVKEIEKKGLAVGLKLLRAELRHLGTEVNLQVLKNIREYLENRIDMYFKTEVKNIIVRDEAIKGVKLNDDTIVEAKNVVIVPGRDGSYWLSNLAKEHDISMKSNHVDIGVRVETNNEIMEEINEHLYEGKFIYRTKVGSTVRTFCSNPS
ncbi:MAG: FAD-dependent oxidoreductase, partial [Candidatus Izemoplasmatales bacterium]